MSATDYRALIDDEVWAYIDKVNACYPAEAVDFDIAGQRRVYNDMCRVFYQGRPQGVQVWDEPHGGVPCRRYEIAENSGITVIYYHGGGFVVGGLDSHDDVCAEICARTGHRVVSVDYGLAPEVVFPDCFNDAFAAYQAIAAAFAGGVVLAGDSAGGNLAAGVAHAARGQGGILGQVLIYPGLGGDWSLDSYQRHANAPHLTTADMQFYMKTRTGGQTPPSGDARFAPLQATDFTKLPPTVCVVAQCDPLASDGAAYRDAIVAAGGRAVCFNHAGLVHGCLRARVMSRKAAAFFDQIVGAVAALAQQDWPFEA